MKNLLSFLFSFSFTIWGFAQGSWVQKADFGGIGRFASIGFSIGTKGYVGTGESNSNAYHKDFWEWDVSTNSWTQKSDFAGGEIRAAAAFSIGTKGYIGTGNVYGIGATTSFWEWDQITNIWTQKADFGGAQRYGAVGFAIGKNGYIGTGSSNSGPYYSDFWEWNGDIASLAYNTWTQKADVPGDTRRYAIGISIEGKGYVGLGDGWISPASDFWEWSPSGNSWVQKASCPATGKSGSFAFTIGKNGYVGAGGNSSKEFWEWNSTTNIWISKTNFGGAGRSLAAGFSMGSKGYVATGYSGNHLKDFWQFNPWYYGFTASADSICFGSTVTITNATTDPEAYAYSWKFLQTTLYDSVMVIDTLTASVLHTFNSYGGNYSVQMAAYDTNGVFLGGDTMTIIVSKFNPLTVISKPDTCTGGVGSISVNASGAITPYNYLWSNNGTTQTISGLSPSNYSVTVSDALGCSVAGAGTVGVYTSTLTPTSSSPDTCSGKVGVLIPPSGGTFPYTFVWNNGSTTGQSVTGLSAGNYSLAVTDKNGCSAVNTVTVGVYTSTISSTFIPKPDTCAGMVGSIQANVTGGTAPYTFLWNNNATTQNVSSLASGNYSIVITDKNGCSHSDSVLVGIFTSTVNISFNSTLASCHNADGSLVANPAGGTLLYSYVWSNGTSAQTANNLFAGNYTVNVTDKNGCTATGVSLVGTSNSIATPAICMVSVDSLSKNNVIMWDKTALAHIDSFIVLRETSANTYSTIGAVPYDSLSSFIDTVRTKYFPNTGDPNTGTYRYKLKMVDSCGNYSQLSPFHNTIYIINNSGTFSWPQLYTIEGSSNPVANYVLLRDNISNGNWVVVSSVTGTQQTITDPQYTTYQSTASWRVETQWAISCNPTVKDPQVLGYNTSRSNIYSLVNGVHEYYNNPMISIYPNPSSGQFVIYGLQSGVNSLDIYDVYGKCVFQTTLDSKSQVVNPLLSSGMYLYKISDKHTIIGTGKLIIK